MPLSGAAAARGGTSPAPTNGRRGADGTKDAGRQLLDDYTLGEELGQGAFGVVYACQRRGHKEDNRAVKMVDKVETPVKEIKREAEILDKVDHINVVKFHEVYYEKCFVCIVMDRYMGGDLIAGMQSHWESKGRIPCTGVKHIMRQCAVALEVLHSKGVVHRDVKGDNYLLDRLDILDTQCLVVLTDFGTAIKCKVAEHVRGFVGTRTYWSPEFYGNDYGQKVDVWAYGVIVYGLLEGRFPFKDEEAVKLRKPKLHSDLPAECVDFVRALIKKEDGRRASSAECITHAWIKDTAVASAPVPHDPDDRHTPKGEEEDWKKDAKERLNEGGPKNLHRERRYELVERLENAAGGGRGASTHFLSPTFDIEFKHEKKTVKFDWWPEATVKDTVENPDRATEVDEGGADETSGLFARSAIEATLTDHGIDTNLFGKGDAKTLDMFLAEVKAGQARLMLDASEYKKMVRVVDVVLLRVSFKSSSGEVRYLVITKEKYPDGRMREGLNRLPGTKKEPHENPKKVTARILRDQLGMQDCKVLFDFKRKEYYEEEEESPSYPGVRTVYRKEIVEGQVSTSDPAMLKRIMADGKGEYSFEDTTKQTRFLQWGTEAECKAMTPVPQLRAPKNTTENQISGLVTAPMAIDEDALKKYLSDNGVDVTRFGSDDGATKSLKEFAAELSNSEATLARDKFGKVMRVVDVCVLWLRMDSQVLVQSAEKYANGQTKEKALLPGMKKLCQESPFASAKRILDKLLQIDENFVNLEERQNRSIEDKKDSPSYPGLQTLYRKRVICGDVSKPDGARSSAPESF